MKGRALLHMRCLHCGKRLSLLRKLSDGEFCSTEHRALFDRLNNDLGLQRLIASQGAKERAKPALPKRPTKLSAAEARIEAETPPLGEALRPPWLNPIAARRVSQHGVDPLLGPKAAEIPQAHLRPGLRGLTGNGQLVAALLKGAPMETAGLQAEVSPIPLVLASAPAVCLGTTVNADSEPQRRDELNPLVPGRAVERSLECLSPQTEACLPTRETSAPTLSLALTQHGPEGAAARRTDSEPRRPDKLNPLVPGRAVKRSLECLSPRSEVCLTTQEASVPKLSSQPESGAGLDAVEATHPLPVLHPLNLADRKTLSVELASQFEIGDPAAPAAAGCQATASLESPATLGLSVQQMGREFRAEQGNPTMELGTAVTAKPRLRFKTEQIVGPDLIPELQVELQALALFACAAAGSGAPVSTTELKAAAVDDQVAPEISSKCRPLERALDFGSLESLSVLATDALLPWHESGTLPLKTEYPEACAPALSLQPEVPTATQALEMEVVEAAETVAEAEAVESAPAETVAAEPEEVLPAFQDQQRRFGVLRPMERPPTAAACPSSVHQRLWGAALETPAQCPRLRMKPDHADGSGSRSQRSDNRSRAALDRFKSVQEKIPGGRFWRSAPADLKWIGLALPLILGLVVWSFRGSVAPVEASLPQQSDPSKTVIAKQVHRFQKVLLSRAAIRLFDDFRGGLSAWNGKDGWAKTWRYTDSSFLEPGDLAIYTPTVEMRDYTMEFLGQIERRSLNWVFRAKDPNNYYAMRIVITRGGPLPAASMVRYTVIDGKESAQKTLPLPLPLRPDTVYRVRMEVTGSQFTTYVQGQLVDSFEDDKLPEGGIGFWSPRGDSSLLRWVEVMHQYDYLGRLCALLAPYPLQGGGQQAD